MNCLIFSCSKVSAEAQSWFGIGDFLLSFFNRPKCHVDTLTLCSASPACQLVASQHACPCKITHSSVLSHAADIKKSAVVYYGNSVKKSRKGYEI